MHNKDIELKRITKTAALLMESGTSPNSIPKVIVERCVGQQSPDGGWVGIVDTMWNINFLKLIDSRKYSDEITRGLKYLDSNTNKEGLWGRSVRDISRIPVSGMMLYLLPELAGQDRLEALEKLWIKEFAGITYKAAYTLMAFRKNDYSPAKENLVDETLVWLVNQQKYDGGFSPWYQHPVDSDVFCTSIACLGLTAYKESVNIQVFKKTLSWLENNQLKSGIWKFHEIEDGASWGLFALAQLNKTGLSNG